MCNGRCDIRSEIYDIDPRENKKHMGRSPHIDVALAQTRPSTDVGRKFVTLKLYGVCLLPQFINRNNICCSEPSDIKGPNMLRIACSISNIDCEKNNKMVSFALKYTASNTSAMLHQSQ